MTHCIIHPADDEQTEVKSAIRRLESEGEEGRMLKLTFGTAESRAGRWAIVDCSFHLAQEVQQLLHCCTFCTDHYLQSKQQE